MVAASELPINTGANATQMAQEIFGDGVQVVSATYSGDNRSSGIYSNGDSVSAATTPGDTGVILSTGHAADYTNSAGGGGGGGWWGGWGGSAEANQATNTSTNTSGINDDDAFNKAAGTATYDASFLEVSFIPDGEMMTIQFVFSSEEYPEYVTGLYQDFIGVWVNDEQVDLSIGDGDIDPNNINGGNNESLFISNTNDQYNTEMDGFTATMTLKMPVNVGQVNTLKIGIADVQDSNYDSNLMIAGGSVQTALIANDDTVNVAPGGSKTVDVLANDDGPGNSTLTLTHINGQEVSAGSVVTLSTGQQIQVNADSTLTIIADNDEESVNFSYTTAIGNGNGTSDTAFVTVNQVPCFVAGTMIRTPEGDVPVETLEPGDLVMTRDEGAQPLRWTGARQVAALGKFAPIRIRANTFGAHDDLYVSPLHRVLIRDSVAELLFGHSEVLVAARDLVNDHSVVRAEGGMVHYVHLLFDRHQVVWSAGLETESFLPGPQTAQSFEADIVQEICTLFPEIDPETGAGYGPSARRTLRRYEARLLTALDRAA
ncbi:Hint domain-containing protein [Thalassovita taeanensis]|uniref:Hint domain-containing protein n=1 Tax=Thalassovita taeanensis TaxID=657014 RepID=A0A1H9DUP8_9RHOB|nr:Hint domain-containing protein [Thalassovita taeanensis]SEQ17131.1 Hint domain-containing protein [Thalassovita taeanensis]